ncbi:hypothetical protein NPIL_546811 [Nephila pilipes]|uniref:Uncharacterized protein n=1 Tax=Nephila pilipes TaxID=299642 RepID=A0A8X6QYT4_NEPPI|nr:hypothetical protein NPIL_546811 [Nephila pilipes]
MFRDFHSEEIQITARISWRVFDMMGIEPNPKLLAWWRSLHHDLILNFKITKNNFKNLIFSYCSSYLRSQKEKRAFSCFEKFKNHSLAHAIPFDRLPLFPTPPRKEKPIWRHLSRQISIRQVEFNGTWGPHTVIGRHFPWRSVSCGRWT